MAQTNYQRGRTREYATRDKLYKLGAAYVMRAAQSKGKADLLALWPRLMRTIEGHLLVDPPPWLVQCKTGTGSMSKKEKTELIDLAKLTGSRAILARTKKSGRGIELIDLATNQEVGVEVRHGSHRTVSENPPQQTGGGSEG
jgi:hypothetical protein